LADETAAINWPIPLENALLSEKDQAHPHLNAVVPMKPKKTLVLGANGQLGKAIREVIPEADFLTRQDFDVTDEQSVNNINWNHYSIVINASAYTAVDNAETPEGRTQAWNTNVSGLGRIVQKCRLHNILFIHFSSDYVFDGRINRPYVEKDLVNPLGVYSQTKASGDQLVSTLDNFYILRTSWAIGDGHNFVRTMVKLAKSDISPRVVNDQIGRLTFTKDLAAAIVHLIKVRPDPGIYNLSNEGPSSSWADIACKVFELTGHDPNRVVGVKTDEYFAGKQGVAPRPLWSMLDLSKIEATGFTPENWETRMAEYLA
jgi:dTDP-4-dehydrorhamnose 3,5-epimerase